MLIFQALVLDQGGNVDVSGGFVTEHHAESVLEGPSYSVEVSVVDRGGFSRAGWILYD